VWDGGFRVEGLGLGPWLQASASSSGRVAWDFGSLRWKVHTPASRFDSRCSRNDVDRNIGSRMRPPPGETSFPSALEEACPPPRVCMRNGHPGGREGNLRQPKAGPLAVFALRGGVAFGSSPKTERHRTNALLFWFGTGVRQTGARSMIELDAKNVRGRGRAQTGWKIPRENTRQRLTVFPKSRP
jgi:hypothetical protein